MGMRGSLHKGHGWATEPWCKVHTTHTNTQHNNQTPTRVPVTRQTQPETAQTTKMERRTALNAHLLLHTRHTHAISAAVHKNQREKTVHDIGFVAIAHGRKVQLLKMRNSKIIHVTRRTKGHTHNACATP